MRTLFTWRRLGISLLTLVCLGAAIVLGGPRVVATMRNRPPDDFGQSLSPLAPAEQVLQPQVASGAAGPAGEDYGPAAISQAAELGIDAAPAGPPPLAPVSAFQPLAAPPATPPGNDAESIDDSTLARLQQIRQRLEQLGADYVLVETTDGSGLYRFHCRMLVTEDSRFTRPFESIAADPLAAGENVLREVEAWRTAALAEAVPAATRLE